jgi:poly(beta-D-mannuronate) C5 epimerase
MRKTLFYIGHVVSLALTLVGQARAQEMEDYLALRGQVEASYHQASGLVKDAATASSVRHGFSSVHEASRLPIAFPLPILNDAPQGHMQLVDLRVALIQFALFAGSNDQLSVVRAQSALAPKVIAIQGGAVDLDELMVWISEQNDPELYFGDNMFRVPIVVFSGAEFKLSRGEALRLSRFDGAFLANFGTLTIAGAKVAAVGEENPTVPDFAPFFTTVGTGMVQISDAEIEGLGFGETALFSGVAVLNRGLYAPIGRSFLVGSVLRENGTVTFYGTRDASIQGNIFSDSRRGALVLRAATKSEVVGNIFLDTAAGSSLRATDGTTESQLVSNVVLNGDGTGIVIDRGSHQTALKDNLIWRNERNGVLISRSDCVAIARNSILNNKKKGLEMRSSRGSQIRANDFMGNRSAGLFIGDQSEGTHTPIEGNVFVGNRTGLEAASAHKIVLNQNDFSNQFPRFLAGDMAAQSQKIVSDLRGQHSIELVAGGVEMFNQAPLTCQIKKDS